MRTMINFPRRFWPRRSEEAATVSIIHRFRLLRPSYAEPLLTPPERPWVLIPPIPLVERKPGPADLGGFDSNCCWWGHWQDDHWLWVWDYEPVRDETHWLPATVEVLPARCFPPEVG